jgi:hypothetical protein
MICAAELGIRLLNEFETAYSKESDKTITCCHMLRVMLYCDRIPALDYIYCAFPFSLPINFDHILSVVLDKNMASIHRSESQSNGSCSEKKDFSPEIIASDVIGVVDTDDDVAQSEHLHRALSSRQVTMIAIGGAIGTGLIIGT